MTEEIRTRVQVVPDGYKVIVGITAYTLSYKELLNLLFDIVRALRIHGYDNIDYQRHK